MEKIKRIIFAVIAIPILALVLILGNKYIVDALCSVIAILALKEYFSVVKKVAKPVQWLGYIACALIAFIHIIPTFLLMLAVFAIPLLVIIFFTQVVVTEMKYTLTDIAITLFGMAYVIGLIVFLPLLYGSENGKILIWYLLLSAWGTDTFAYFLGIKFGKHKITKISPKKSVEGCIAGVLGAVVTLLTYTLFVNMFTDLQISYVYMIPIAVALSIFAQLGDLSASSIKRNMDVKDFSNLIPGHGGVMDRIDSIIFIAPIAYFLLNLIV